MNINFILLVGITTFISRVFSLDNCDVQNQYQRYDYIDVAKETAGSRSKGQTTRIFTTDNELDEKFWLKYLGEDFHHAVQLKVDDQNNVVPLIEDEPPSLNALKLRPKAEKHTRFVRQPTTEEEKDKQLPVEQLDEHNANESENSTEEPETLDGYLKTTTPTTSTTTSTLPPANKKLHSCNTRQQFNNKKPSKRKDNFLLRNKYSKQKVAKVKPYRIHKTTREPVVVHIPETDDTVHYIKEKRVPIVPTIYHQKAELHPESKSNRRFFMHANQLFAKQIPNKKINNQNMEIYSQPLQLDTQHLYPELGTGYSTHPHQPHLTTIHDIEPRHKRRQQHQILAPTQYTTHKRLKQIYP